MTLEDRTVRRVRCRRRGWAVLAAVAAGGTAALPSVSRGQSVLVVDGGNSPYTSTATATYSTITVGNVSTGVLAQTGGTLTSTGGVIVGNNAGSVGTYNLSGSAALVANVSRGGLAVGYSGTGTLNAFNSSSVNLGVNPFILGANSGSSGTLNVGDSATITAADLLVGDNGAGAVRQTGGP